MLDHVTYPPEYDPRISPIYALNEADVRAPENVVWKLLVECITKRGQIAGGGEHHPAAGLPIQDASGTPLVRSTVAGPLVGEAAHVL